MLKKYQKTLTSGQKIKTTILLDKTLKKLAQIHALQNDLTLGELIESALEEKIVEK